MATAFTYATLKSRLQNWSEDQGTTFATDVDDIIKLGEDKCLKALGLSIFDSNEAITAVTAATKAKPTGTILTRSLSLVIGGSKVHLKKKTKSYIEDYWPIAATTGVPKFFADDYSATEWLIGPTPAAGPNYSGEAVVLKRPASIVDTSPSWLGTNVGDLLFKACQIEANIYMVADERLDTLRTEFKDALTLNLRDLRSLIRTDYGPLASQPTAQGER